MRAAAILLLASLRALAQDGPPLFTTSANNVIVDAAVIGDPRASAGLQREDFVLRDNGQPVTIAGIAQDQLPLDIVLVCQSPIHGGSPNNGTQPHTVRVGSVWYDTSSPSQRLISAAANAVVGARAADRVAIVVYGTDPRIELKFTQDRKAVATAIKSLGELGDSRSENIVVSSEGLAIEYAVRMLADVERGDPNARTNRRRLIIMISNVLGTGVRYADEPIIRRLWDQDIVFSTIEDLAPAQATKFLQHSAGGDSQTVLFQRYSPVHIAQATGGDRVVPLDPQHPPDLLTPIRQRYTLWFDQPPQAAAGETRTIKVDLSDAARLRFPNAVVRAREGYVTR